MIRVEQAHVQVAAVSHAGMSGKNNEDRYAVSAYQLGPDDPTPALVAVLADGIGGHRAGEVAAELAVETLSRSLEDSDGKKPLAELQNAVSKASQQVFAYAQSDMGRQGMGSTCACAWVIGSRLYTANVGDSRIYLLRGDSIQQISKDHTWVQEALEQGVITPEQVRGHPNQHVIRRYLGSPQPAQAGLGLYLNPGESEEQARANQGMRLHPDDILLVCSDGLTDLVENEEILATLRSQPLDQAVQGLVDLANTRGGHDNITVIGIHIPPPPPHPVSKARRWVRSIFIGLIVLLVVVGLAAAALQFVRWREAMQPTPTPTLTPVPVLTSTPRQLPGEATLAPTFTPTSRSTSTPERTSTP
ncbi:MAG: protein phosphatase 2C domain-containing protein [Anaerolineaceae bacterium]